MSTYPCFGNRHNSNNVVFSPKKLLKKDYACPAQFYFTSRSNEFIFVVFQILRVFFDNGIFLNIYVQLFFYNNEIDFSTVNMLCTHNGYTQTCTYAHHTVKRCALKYYVFKDIYSFKNILSI